MSDPKTPLLIIEVLGGVVTEVRSNLQGSVQVEVLDHDDGSSAEQLLEFQELPRQEYPRPRFWRAESDGEPHARTHYVINSGTLERRECSSGREALELARALNAAR